MKNTNYSVKKLGDSFKGRPVSPSESLYYGQYPYRLTFDNTGFDTHRKRIHFKRQMEDFELDFLKSSVRTYFSNKRLVMYFYTIKDLETTYNMFHSQITDVAGPINDEHANLLSSADSHVEIRKRNYYNKYDCKILLFTPFRRHYYYNSRSANGSRELVKSMMDFFKTNLESFKLKSDSMYFNSFYTTYAEFADTLPFAKLQFPEGRFIVYKVLIH